jgi:hypothetical protein
MTQNTVHTSFTTALTDIRMRIHNASLIDEENEFHNEIVDALETMTDLLQKLGKLAGIA